MLEGENVYFNIWRVDVGRVPLYLLDTNLNENSPKHRVITRNLYDPDRDTRIRQEILLGIGGIQALKLLGISPSTFHVNEGHSAFLLLERIRLLMHDHHLSFQEAKEIVWSSTIFTTHTPVAAGHESFTVDLMHRYFDKYARKLKIKWRDFLSLGEVNPQKLDEDNENGEFSMTALAIGLSAHVNGVSKLHGEVSREMWQKLYPGIPQKEIPIGSIVNGVHARTWLSPSLNNLFLQYNEAGSTNELADLNMWNIVDQISDEELWSIHEFNRGHLVSYARNRLAKQRSKRGTQVAHINDVNEILDSNAMTIVFARRFTTYKRGYLLFRDIERLKRILCNPERPVQLILAGKAHPVDHAGKEIIKQIFQIANGPELRKHILFIEDYDLDIASFLVQGADVWLNTPRRPMEACGTSGMKTAMNGGLNLSVLDGWWDEAFRPEVGWTIGERYEYSNHEEQDEIESALLYTTLEREIIPLFYERHDNNVPHEWVKMMKNSIRELSSVYNSHHMIMEYTKKYYLSANDLHQRLIKDNCSEAKELSAWRDKIVSNWSQINIIKVASPTSEFIQKGHNLQVRAWIDLANINPNNVIVECYYGLLDNRYQIDNADRIQMDKVDTQDTVSVFHTDIPCPRGGRYGFTVRVLPGHHNLAINLLPGLIKWFE
jgi:starch phosphorylase